VFRRWRQAYEERVQPHLLFGEHDLTNTVFSAAYSNDAFVSRIAVSFTIGDNFIEFILPLVPID